MNETKKEYNLNEGYLSPNFLTFHHIATLCYSLHLEVVLTQRKVRTGMS
jgi:hypothetical protein